MEERRKEKVFNHGSYIDTFTNVTGFLGKCPKSHIKQTKLTPPVDTHTTIDQADLNRHLFWVVW